MADITLTGLAILGSAPLSLNRSSDEVARSVGRLSSGVRITRAADDIAALSVSTGIESRLTSLRSARLNLQQASALIQVMEGGLQQIESILQRMNSLTIQATGGGLTDVERGFLDLEFQGLKDEIDRIASQTEFNGIRALSLDSTQQIFNEALEFDDALGEEYAAYLVFSSNWIGNNRFIRIGSANNTAPSELIVWRNDTSIGNPAFNVQNVDSLRGKLQGLVDLLNDPNGPISQNPIYGNAKYELINENTVKITGRSRGELSQLFFVSDRISHPDVRDSLEVIGSAVRGSGGDYDYILKNAGNGSETGLVAGSTSVSGTSQTDLIVGQLQSQAEVRLQFDTLVGGLNNGNRLSLDNGLTGLESYRFRNNAVDPVVEIQIGSDNIESIKNAIRFFEELPANNQVNQLANNAVAELYVSELLEFERDGLDLVIRSKLPGNPLDLFSDNPEVAENIPGAAFDFTTIDNGSDQGVNTDGVVNKDFIGNISGFKAVHTGFNALDLSVTVGEATYSASISDTNPSRNTRVRFFSDENGYFDVDLAESRGMDVGTQEEADIFAQNFDVAFSGYTFYQDRVVSNFRPYGDLRDVQLSIKREDFSENIIIEDFSVTAVNDSEFGSAVLSITINDETYLSQQNLDQGIDPYASIRLISTDDSNRVVTLKNTDRDISLLSSDAAAVFEEDMITMLPFGSITTESNSLVFQAGEDAANTIIVNTVNASTQNIFSGESISINTAKNATHAATIVASAIDIVTAQRAEIGAMQQSADIASNVLNTAIINQDSAVSDLRDTDIATTSTDFAISQVRMNASIAVIAQANQLQRRLIDEIYSSLLQL